MSTWELVNPSEGKLTLEINSQEWKDAQTKAFNKICKDVTIKGFRKGQAPKGMVKKMINPQSVLYDAVDVVAYKAYLEAVKEHGLITFGKPAIEEMPVLTEEACTLVFKLNVEPEATLTDLSNVEYKVENTEVSEEEINADLAAQQKRFAELVVSEEAAKEGDTVNIDYVGTKDGVAFDGGSANGHDLVLGSHSFIEGFEEGVVGMSTGEEKDLNLTFPEDYHAEELKGAAVVFHVKVNKISKEVLPELNDDLAKDILGDDNATLDALKEKVKTQLSERKEKDAKNAAEGKLLDAFNACVEVEIPEALVEEEAKNMVSNYAYQLQSAGLSIDMFLKYTGQTVESLVETYKADASKRIRTTLGLRAYAKANNITVTDEDFDAKLAEIATQTGRSVDEVKLNYDLIGLRDSYMVEKSLEALKQNCTK